MSAESPPEWLPDGWIMGIRKTRQGKREYYTSAADGCTFQSKEEVLNFLGVEKNESCISDLAFCSDENKNELEEEPKEFPVWLPPGWILEIKTRRSGTSAGHKYKCYFDPCTRSRFYSKNEVLRFLKSRKVPRKTSKMKKDNKKNSIDNVTSQIVYSPNGLPHGWIRETKLRDNKGVLRKDSYYIDPVNGYVFNSLKDAIRYVETGCVSKHVYRRKRAIREMYSVKESSPCRASAKKLKAQGTGRQCFFDEKTPNSSDMLTKRHKPSQDPEVQKEEVTVQKRKRGPKMTMLCQPFPNFESAQSAPNQLVNHTDEKTIQEGEINPSPATNSNGKSNYSIEEAPKADKKPVKSSLVSNVASNECHLGEGLELGLAKQESPSENGRPSSNSSPVNYGSVQPTPNQLANHSAENAVQEGPNGPSPVINSTGKSNNSIEEAPKVEKTPAKLSLESNMTLSDHPLGKEIELSLSEQVAPAENDVSSKTKTSKLRSSSRKAKVIDPMPIPRRSSRRLAGVEADPVIDSIVNKPARSTKPKQQNSMPKELIRSESLQIQSAVDEGATTVNQSTINWPEFTETSPFGDSWPDPCIEFAFKTLTGDLPVLDDAMAIQEYFEQQLVAVERSSSSGTALLPDGKVEGPPSSTNFERPPTKPDLQQRNDTTQMMTKER